MATRARSFEERLRGEFSIHILYRAPNKIGAIFRFLWSTIQLRPSVCYVLDMGFSGVLAAGLYRTFFRARIAMDTGDAIYELSRITGNRRGLGLWLTKILEKSALAMSDRVVVRSHPHQELLVPLGIAADVVPDGVDLEQFRPGSDDDLRRELGFEGHMVIGILGSVVWSPRLQMCYGWEIVDVIDLLRDLPVKGFVIGDGSGLAELKTRCASRGLEDRIVFAGRIQYDDLPRYLNLMDICISTQTNDQAGQVRTTGKLPLYLACGRFVLATAVGEAARVLPSEMLIDYNGSQDKDYPLRLSGRVKALMGQPELLRESEKSVAIARAHFDYDQLAFIVGRTIRELLLGTGAPESTSSIPLGPRPGV